MQNGYTQVLAQVICPLNTQCNTQLMFYMPPHILGEEYSGFLFTHFLARIVTKNIKNSLDGLDLLKPSFRKENYVIRKS